MLGCRQSLVNPDRLLVASSHLVFAEDCLVPPMKQRLPADLSFFGTFLWFRLPGWGGVHHSFLSPFPFVFSGSFFYLWGLVNLVSFQPPSFALNARFPLSPVFLWTREFSSVVSEQCFQFGSLQMFQASADHPLSCQKFSQRKIPSLRCVEDGLFFGVPCTRRFVPPPLSRP